jgi:hypothetical protein
MNAFLRRIEYGVQLSAAAALLAGGVACAQVITIDTHGNQKAGEGANVDRRYRQIQPTKVELTNSILDTKTRLELERILQAEQGFAMRPFPRGHKGLTLEANGKLEPAGEAYLNLVTEQGLSSKPGERLIITDLKFEKDKIIFMINGGPDAKHRFLRHIQIGSGPSMNPVVQDDGKEPTGSRLVLTFKDHVPALTASQVKALLSPLISFDLKTPIQAFCDTLPPKLKDAIMGHQVLVGMNTEMVIYAVGPPDSKTRETENQMPFEEWIYGKPPKPTQFVRINGNRVIRLEVAKVGEPPQVFTEDVVSAMMRTDGNPVIAADANTKTVALGDTVRDPDRQAPVAGPSLHQAGDQPDSMSQRDPASEMKPVQFPKQTADDYPDASKLPRNTKPDDADKPSDNSKPGDKPAAKPDAPATKTDDSSGA